MLNYKITSWKTSKVITISIYNIVKKIKLKRRLGKEKDRKLKDFINI